MLNLEEQHFFGELLPGWDRDSTWVYWGSHSLWILPCSPALSPAHSTLPHPTHSTCLAPPWTSSGGGARGLLIPLLSSLESSDLVEKLQETVPSPISLITMVSITVFSGNSINWKEAQELKKFPFALFPTEMLKGAFTEGLHSPRPLPRLWKGRKSSRHREQSIRGSVVTAGGNRRPRGASLQELKTVNNGTSGLNANRWKDKQGVSDFPPNKDLPLCRACRQWLVAVGLRDSASLKGVPEGAKGEDSAHRGNTRHVQELFCPVTSQFWQEPGLSTKRNNWDTQQKAGKRRCLLWIHSFKESSTTKRKTHFPRWSSALPGGKIGGQGPGFVTESFTG